MVNDQIVNYLITWLCYGDEEAAKRVAYTDDEKALETYDVIIVPNGYLGKELVVPELKKPEGSNRRKAKRLSGRTSSILPFSSPRVPKNSSIRNVTSTAVLPHGSLFSLIRAACKFPVWTSTHGSSSNCSTARSRKAVSGIYTSRMT